MSKVPAHLIREIIEDADQRVELRHVPWSQYEALLELRGESCVPRMTYLDGRLELMTPSKGHEITKKMIARIVEAYAQEVRIRLWSYGSWTLKNPGVKRGAEPDECYCVGAPESKGIPDFAIEVNWTHGGMDKHDVYRKLGVREIWDWADGAIMVFELQGDDYKPIPRSVALPDLDLALVARLATHEDPLEAVDQLLAWVRSHPKSS